MYKSDDKIVLTGDQANEYLKVVESQREEIARLKAELLKEQTKNIDSELQQATQCFQEKESLKQEVEQLKKDLEVSRMWEMDESHMQLQDKIKEEKKVTEHYKTELKKSKLSESTMTKAYIKVKDERDIALYKLKQLNIPVNVTAYVNETTVVKCEKPKKSFLKSVSLLA